MDYFTTLGFVFLFLPTFSVFTYLKTVSLGVTNSFLVSSKSPLFFLTFSPGLSYLLGNGSLIFEDMISVLDLTQPVNSRISSSF